MKIIAVGMNYALHNQELGHTSVNKEPVIFMKPDSAILKDGNRSLSPIFSDEVHYETEVVVRIFAVWEKTLRRVLPVVIMTH